MSALPNTSVFLRRNIKVAEKIACAIQKLDLTSNNNNFINKVNINSESLVFFLEQNRYFFIENI